MDRITLELDRESAPIAGWVCGEHGAPQAFSGWTGLFSVLEQMVTDAIDGPSPSAATAFPPPRAERAADRPPR